MDKQQLDLARKVFAELHERNRVARERLRQADLSGWRRLAGALADEMVSASSVAERHLFDPEPNLRICSIEVLSKHWRVRPGSKSAGEIRMLAVADPNVEVRAAAMLAVARCYRSTDDAELGILLANVVKSPHAEQELRRSAYYGLHLLRGVSLAESTGSSVRSSVSPMHVPEDVDWPFVESFLIRAKPAAVAGHEQPELSGSRRLTMGRTPEGLGAARAAFGEARFLDCVRLMTDAIAMQPENLGARMLRAKAFAKLGQFRDAIQDFSAVIAITPKWAEPYAERGASYGSIGLIDRAIADYREAESLGDEPPAESGRLDA